MRGHEASVMSRALIGHERTRLRRAAAPLLAAHCEPVELARALGIRVHTARAVLDGRLLPGRRFAGGVARVRGVSLSALLAATSL